MVLLQYSLNHFNASTEKSQNKATQVLSQSPLIPSKFSLSSILTDALHLVMFQK